MQLWIPGTPKPQGSKRAFINKGTGRINMVEADKGLAAWRDEIKNQVYLNWIREGMRSFNEPVSIRVDFFMPKPKTVDRWWPRVYDLDKMCRAVGDGLSVSSGAISDDNLILEWHARKFYAVSPEYVGAKIIITPIKPETWHQTRP
jgi:hypothetical protein